MNLAQLKQISPKLSADIAEACKKHGLEVRRGLGASLDPGTGLIRFRFEAFDATPAEPGGDVEIPEAKEFKRSALIFDLKPEWLGREIKHGGVAYKIAGLCPKRRRFPVLVERVSDRKRSLLPADFVRLSLSRAS